MTNAEKNRAEATKTRLMAIQALKAVAASNPDPTDRTPAGRGALRAKAIARVTLRETYFIDPDYTP